MGALLGCMPACSRFVKSCLLHSFCFKCESLCCCQWRESSYAGGEGSRGAILRVRGLNSHAWRTVPRSGKPRACRRRAAMICVPPRPHLRLQPMMWTLESTRARLHPRRSRSPTRLAAYGTEEGVDNRPTTSVRAPALHLTLHLARPSLRNLEHGATPVSASALCVTDPQHPPLRLKHIPHTPVE